MVTITMHAVESSPRVLVHAKAIDDEFWSFEVISVGAARFQILVQPSEVNDFLDQMNSALNKMVSRELKGDGEDNDDSLIPEQEAQYRQDTQ